MADSSLALAERLLQKDAATSRCGGKVLKVICVLATWGLAVILGLLPCTNGGYPATVHGYTEAMQRICMGWQLARPMWARQRLRRESGWPSAQPAQVLLSQLVAAAASSRSVAVSANLTTDASSSQVPLETDTEVEDDDDEGEQPKRSKRSKNKRFHQHVNPLSSTYQRPAKLSSTWIQESFANTSLPVVLDIGSAKGTWGMKYAEEHEDVNVLGLEIRPGVVDVAQERAKSSGLKNVCFVQSNANVDLERILNDLSAFQIPLRMVTIQFPDPYFKAKQQKRRVVNEELVDVLAAAMPVGRSVFLQSDVLDVQQYMVDTFAASPFFSPGSEYNLQSLQTNPKPYNLETEREIAVGKKNEPVYRMLFERNDVTFNKTRDPPEKNSQVTR
eukprot:gnl/TRDRNA2_/TRDRNA2_135113_c0_seq2.p1 gnl/TRDRNA2_/TRDRNA2_135113_c0~~gnl/TRDRNA2_/TRDRNA2_135113_c0_seq2.p1  ORF type:complete len:388 (+),score=75.97 gnl/TRDRNA2_/TRDRNA2_135113_c0_seq2:90-1253(+)